MTVVVKIAHQLGVHAHLVEFFTNIWHGLRGFGRIDCDAHQLGTGLRQFFDLNRGAECVNGVGVSHGLHDHRMRAADDDLMRAVAHHDFVCVVACADADLNAHNHS